MNLNSVFAKVEVTPSQGIAILNTFAEANSDKDPTLVESINKAIADLSTAAEEPVAEDSAPTGTHTSRSR